MLAAALSACGSLPPLTERPVSKALTDTSGTRLGRFAAPGIAAHPGLTGIHPLEDARAAFAARVLLARAAERSLDVQYYIWRNDLSGGLLFDAVFEAAERGVRVRLLLDDANTSGLDPTLSALDAHPNIEVRLFNPFVGRGSRALGYLADFSRLNRRMHNKSFTADNQITIVGGRNVGDEYFGAGEGVGFVDLDVAAIGAVVPKVSREFDAYWASESAYPIEHLVARAGEEALVAYRAAAVERAAAPDALGYAEAVRQSVFSGVQENRRVEMQWSAAHLVSDDPGKALDKASASGLLVTQLEQVLGEPGHAVDLVSPYFVPGQEAVDAFTKMARRGVKVRILTNSLEANDVAPVHAGYAKWRKPLLQGGVQLFELRRQPGALPNRGGGVAGSSAASLHAKTFAVDGRRLFVGSFNFDPRSKLLNTELGLVVDNPTLAHQLSSAFDAAIPAAAYELSLSPDGESLVWTEHEGDQTRRHTREPGVGVLKRAWVGFLSLLPIDWML